MKHIIFTILCVSLSCQAWSQKQHTINKSSGTLKIMGIDALQIEGHSGKEVIFINNAKSSEEQSQRIKGLRVINSAGLRDNSGIGLSINDSGDITTIQQVTNGASCSCDDGYTIKVPAGLNLYVEHSTTYGDDVYIKGINGEIEISVNYNDVILDNISGPVSAKTVYGDLESVFSSVNQSNPISLVSVYGHVDVSVPSSTKADLNVKTNYGALYSDLDIQIKTVDEKGNLKSVSTKRVNGTLNGGGVEITLNSMYDDVYLRSLEQLSKK